MNKTKIFRGDFENEIREVVSLLLSYKDEENSLLSSRIKKVVSEFKNKTGQEITNIDMSTMFTLIELSENYLKEDGEIIDDDVDVTFFIHNIAIVCVAEYLVKYFKELGYNYNFDDIYQIDSSGYDVYKVKSSDNREINCLDIYIKGFFNNKYTFVMTEDDCKEDNYLKAILEDFAKCVDNTEHKNK